MYHNSGLLGHQQHRKMIANYLPWSLHHSCTHCSSSNINMYTYTKSLFASLKADPVELANRADALHCH